MRFRAAARRSLPWVLLLLPLLVGEGVVAAVVEVPPVEIEEGVLAVLLEGVLGLETCATAATAAAAAADDDDGAAAAGDELAAARAVALVCFLKWYGGRPVLTGDHIELERPLSKPPAILKNGSRKSNHKEEERNTP